MPGTTTVTPTGILAVDAVDSGTRWNTLSLTYSFPTSASFYTGFMGGAYGSGEPLNNFQAFTSVQQAAVTSALAMYSSVSNLTFTQITETSTQTATLRFAESNSPSTAWSYYPSSSPEGGDAWFNNSSHYYDNPAMGNYAWKAIMHEIGHTLGLKHPHDAIGAFGAIPADQDSGEYSVMSYRSYIGAPTNQGYTNETWGYPQTLMMYDIAAIQQMYGANFNYNGGNTVYKWDPNTGQEFVNGVGQATPGANRIFMTVWDGGGNDTYDFSNYTTNLSINLQPGGWTTTSTAQLAYLGNGHYAIGNIANALLYQNNPASLIENAIGGSGNDTITGNTADNKFTGGAGNDHLDGLGGTDTAVFSGLSTNYQITQNADGSWTVADLRSGSPDGTDTLSNIEWLQFNDGTVAVGTVQPPVIAAPTISSISPDTGTVGDEYTNATVLTITGTAAANSIVKVYDGSTLLGSVVASGSGAWSFGTSTLTEGGHGFTATATDSSGNTSTASTVMSVTVDTVAPITPTISLQSVDSNIVGDRITNVNVISLTGTAETNSTIKVYDGSTLLGSATANAEGVWNFVADLSDDQISAPASTATITETAWSSKGSVYLAGTADPDSTVSIFDSANGALLGNAITESDGQWNFVQTVTTARTFAVTQVIPARDSTTGDESAALSEDQAWGFTTGALADGVHNFTAVSTDLAGNVSATSTVLSVTIDTAAPATPAITAYSTDSNVAGDGITNDNTLTLTGSAEANATVKVYDGATLLGSATADGSGNWSYTTAALTNGAHSLSATATDVAGNTSAASAALNVTIDTSAPVVPSIAAYSTDSGTVGDGITNDNTLTLTGSAEANATVKVYDGATLLGSATANGAGAWSFTTAALANGTHSLTATATDVAGNTGAASSALSVMIDTVAPAVPTITSFSPDTGTVGDGVTNTSVLTLTGTAEANATVKVYDGATLLGNAVANSTGAWSFTTATLANATHNLTATATDTAGTTSATSAVLSITVNNTTIAAPVITSFSNDSNVAGDGVTNDNILTLTGTAGASATVKVYDGVTLLGSVSANGAGAWSFTTAALANGAHSLSATATDVAGNTSAASAALTVTIDTSAPVVPSITAYSTDSGTAGDGITNDNTLTLTGSAEANATVKVYDGATLLGSATADGSGNWSYTTAALANGTHSLSATATDVAGNTSAASAALNVTIDTSAPATPAIAAYSTDSGTAGDGITNDNTLTLTGTAGASATVKVYDGVTLLGSVSADVSGNWSYTTAALTNGGHSLTATATDVAGNTSAASAALNVTIDTSAPVVPSIASFSTDSGVVGDHITNDNTLTLAGTTEAGSVVKIYDGATLLGSATANGAGGWSFTTAALANGAHSLTATATDVAGNTSAASSALSVTIDTSAPLTPAIASYSTDSGTAGDGITNDNTLTLTGSAEANATVKVYDGVTLLGSVTADGSGNWSYTTAALTNGAHSLTATATDVAGNTSAASSALSVTIDTAAPATPAIAAYSTDSGTAGDGITNDNTLTLTGSAEANATVKVYDGATLLGSTTANGAGAWSFTTAALANGTHSLTATATDVAGNTGAASSALSVMIDTVAPAVPSIAAYSTDSGTAGDGITNDNTLTLTGSAEANATVKVYDGATLLGSATASGAGAWSFTTAALANGAHSLSVTATDVAGNTGAASSALSVTIDTVAPVSPSIASYSTDSNVAGDGITNDNTLTLTGSAEANATVKVYDGVTLLGSVTADGSGNWSYTTAVLTNGAHSLTATATDVAGNTGAASSALSVTIDTVAPAVPTIASFSPDTDFLGDYTTTEHILTLTGTAEANSIVTVFDASTLLGTALVSNTGAWNFMTGELASGIHSFTANAIDTAGNMSVASSDFDVTVSNTIPSIAVNINSFLMSTKGAGLLTGTSEANSTVAVYDTATDRCLGQVTANSSGGWSLVVVGLSPNCAQGFAAIAHDQLGNIGGAACVYGTQGNDTLLSTLANEIFTGKGGNDTYVFSGNFGNDTIKDFQASSNAVQLDHNVFGNFAGVMSHASQVGSDVVISVDANNSLSLHNTLLSQLTANNFHLV